MDFVTLCVAGVVVMLASTFLVIGIRPDLFRQEVVHPRASWGLVSTATLLLVACLATRCVAAASWRTASVGLLVALFIVMSLMLRPIAPVVMTYIGVGCNTLVVLANGGRMPVVVAGYDGPNHVSITATTRLTYLADVFPIMSGNIIDGAYSIGDILVCVSLWWFAARVVSLLWRPS